MENSKALSRKLFLRVLAGLIAGLFLWVWYRVDKHQFKKDSQLEFRHNEDVALGFSYFGKYYLYRDDKTIKAFSTSCTHAGCRIGKTNTSVLQCSCHGSQFEVSTGIPLRGPAFQPLQKLDCFFDTQSKQWVVKMQPKI